MVFGSDEADERPSGVEWERYDWRSPAVFMENTNSFGKRRDTFTLLNQADVFSLSYKRQTELDATYGAILASFRVLN